MHCIAPFGKGWIMNLVKQGFAVLLCWCVALASVPEAFAQNDQSSPQIPVQAAQQTEQQLEQLVAPIALYPDELVAQILAAATYPDQVVQADRWLQANPGLKGDQLAQEVDRQPWDPSVKALTEFPSVLANMDKNLSWTSSLGDAYINQQQDVMNAVQTMRQRAQAAGNLQSTPQQTVTTQQKTIIIEPANPEVVYVPTYDPWIVYGAPVVVWPGWFWYPGLFVTRPGIAFSVGFGVGFFAGFGWGWHHWGADWHNHNIIVNHNTFVSRSRTFVNRGYYANRARGNVGRAGGLRAGDGFRVGDGFRAGGGFRGAPGHAFAPDHARSGMHSGAFSGFNHGGVTRSYSAGGRSSFGGFHGGGSHGGGFHGGGGHSHR